MRFSLPAVAAAMIPLAQGREIGVESAVHTSTLEVVKFGEVRVDSLGIAAWYPSPGIEIPAGGVDLHLRNDDVLANLVGVPSITLDVTLVGVVTAATAVAAMTVPSWVEDQSFSWPLGIGTDFVGAGSGNGLRLVTAIDDLSDSENLPANTTWSVWGSALAENFIFHGFKRSVDGPYTTPKFVEIADGYNPAGSVKKGRADNSSLSMEMVHLSAMGGLTRRNGLKVTVAVKITKDKAVVTEWVLYMGYGVSAMVNRGDGNDEVMEKSEGPYESYMIFVAP